MAKITVVVEIPDDEGEKCGGCRFQGEGYGGYERCTLFNDPLDQHPDDQYDSMPCAMCMFMRQHPDQTFEVV